MCQESTVTVKIILESASTEETDDNIIYFEKEWTNLSLAAELVIHWNCYF